MAYSMADLVAFIWTSILLTSAYGLTQEQEELEVKVADLSVMTPTKHPRKMELRWDNSENITTSANTMKTHNSPMINKNYSKESCCGFSNCGLNHIQKITHSNNSGEDTAAKNFSCYIYNVSFMNCTWTVSTEAPNDVQYYLYSQNAKKEQEIECTNYIKDSQKKHVGCHFDELGRFSGKGYFLVTGTSKKIKIKKFCSEKISLFSIERYTPPSNITVNCSKSNCLIQWQKPKTRNAISDSAFDYQLHIQKQGYQYTKNDLFPIRGSPEIIQVYNLTNYDPEIRYILKIRASHRGENWGEWSEPIELVHSKKPKPSPIYIYVLVVFGTAIFVLSIILVFKRYFVIQRLFPQIPQIKDKVNTCDHLTKEVIWEEFKFHPEKSEEIMTIDIIE